MVQKYAGPKKRRHCKNFSYDHLNRSTTANCWLKSSIASYGMAGWEGYTAGMTPFFYLGPNFCEIMRFAVTKIVTKIIRNK